MWNLNLRQIKWYSQPVSLLKKPQGIPEVKFMNEYSNILKTTNSDIVLSRNERVGYAEKEGILYIRESGASIPEDLSGWRIIKDVHSVCQRCNITNVAIYRNELLRDLSSQRIWQMFKLNGIKVILLEGPQKIVEIREQRLLLRDAHILPTGGHTGIQRLYKTMKKYYYWPKMFHDIEEYVRKCEICQNCKHAGNPVVPMEITSTARSSFKKIYMDLVQIPQSFEGNKYILTVQDDFFSMEKIRIFERKCLRLCVKEPYKYDTVREIFSF